MYSPLTIKRQLYSGEKNFPSVNSPIFLISDDFSELFMTRILISLLELELDFSEEDVEFADRKQLKDLLNNIQNLIHKKS